MVVMATITEAHVAVGERDNPQCCPAAWAIRAVLPAGSRVKVSGARYYVNGRPYDSPPALLQWVMDFDAVGVVPHTSPPAVPLSFPVEVEECVFAELAGAA